MLSFQTRFAVAAAAVDNNDDDDDDQMTNHEKERITMERELKD